jgi:hypothetical protein
VKKRWVILLALALLLGAAAAFRLGRSQREPEYNGKKLSEWAEMRAIPAVTAFPLSQGDIERVVRGMGTNALPWLVEWLDDEPLPRWQTKVLKFIQKFPKRLGGDYATRSLSPVSRDRRAHLARTGIHLLGDDARAAIPDLARLAKNPKAKRGGFSAARFLADFGDEAAPELVEILRTPLAPGRPPAIDHFRLIGATALGTNANAIIEGLVLCLNDRDAYIRGAAVLALGDLMLRRDIAVPALAKTCHDVEPAIREAALGALSNYGDAARPARPTIIQALHDPDAEVRAVAQFTLDQIPE